MLIYYLCYFIDKKLIKTLKLIKIKKLILKGE